LAYYEVTFIDFMSKLNEIMAESDFAGQLKKDLFFIIFNFLQKEF
jgi:hypothetical protein